MRLFGQSLLLLTVFSICSQCLALASSIQPGKLPSYYKKKYRQDYDNNNEIISKNTKETLQVFEENPKIEDLPPNTLNKTAELLENKNETTEPSAEPGGKTSPYKKKPKKPSEKRTTCRIKRPRKSDDSINQSTPNSTRPGERDNSSDESTSASTKPDEPDNFSDPSTPKSTRPEDSDNSSDSSTSKSSRPEESVNPSDQLTPNSTRPEQPDNSSYLSTSNSTMPKKPDYSSRRYSYREKSRPEDSDSFSNPPNSKSTRPKEPDHSSDQSTSADTKPKDSDNSLDQSTSITKMPKKPDYLSKIHPFIHPSDIKRPKEPDHSSDQPTSANTKPKDPDNSLDQSTPNTKRPEEPDNSSDQSSPITTMPKKPVYPFKVHSFHDRETPKKSGYSSEESIPEEEKPKNCDESSEEKPRQHMIMDRLPDEGQHLNPPFNCKVLFCQPVLIPSQAAAKLLPNCHQAAAKLPSGRRLQVMTSRMTKWCSFQPCQALLYLAARNVRYSLEFSNAAKLFHTGIVLLAAVSLRLNMGNGEVPCVA